MPPGLPRPPRIKLPDNPLEPLKRIAHQGRERIEKAGNEIRSVADELHSTIHPKAPTTARETPKEPSLGQDETSSLRASASTGTACIPCSRDHFLTTSSALSEGMRFAREKGVRDHEVMRRIRIALQELDIMERIDLAPEEIVKLKGAEKELADWTLKQSRDLRHSITAIKDVESMEQAAARASTVTEEFMGRLWAIPEEECTTCGEVRERLMEFIERRKREREIER